MKQYFLSICAAALLCYLWQSLTPGGAGKKRSWLIGSLILVLVILSPLVALDGDDLFQSFAAYEAETDDLEKKALDQTKSAMESIISERCTEYILEQTEKFEDVSLEFMFTFDRKHEVPIPVGVQVTGACSAYTQEFLQQILENDLGISAERQVWNIS